MVKRKRTLSTKENTENINHSSDVDHINEDVKRVKVHGSPGRPEGGTGNQEASHVQKSPIASPTSPGSITATTLHEGTVPSSSVVPVNISQLLPDVPLSTPPVVSQTRPMLQLRTSARVLNKQRREETKPEPAPTASLITKKSDAPGLDGEYPEEEDALGGSGIGKKRRRAWELWSMEDKNIFFESINECGKDFEAIQNYLTTKLRKKGAPRSQIKNKDQVRHFYYRTWHKISKYITFNEGVKKATQELYGLINFGELRKKIGGTLDERKAQKLQELIRKGSTSVRVKGKSVRVRTPICRALKKLNQIEEHREHAEVRVPTSITVEVVPASVHAWCRVQGLAHNPRVRITSPLQRPLAVLISHLQEKWRNSNLKLRDTLFSRLTFPLEMQRVTEPILRLMPSRGCSIKSVNVQPEVVMKSSCVSLSSHEARLRRRGEKLGRGSKPKENKQPHEKEVEDREDAARDMERIGGDLVELGGDDERNDKSIAGDSEGKCQDIEGIGGDMEDFGDVSQEEHEDCSDGEVGCLNSPDGESDEIVRFLLVKNKHTTNITQDVHVKEEPQDTDAVGYSTRESLDPDVKVKEESEGESNDTLRQLLALETVANAVIADDDAEVVCTGESTRLTAHVGDTQRGFTSANQISASEEERGSATTPEPEEEDRNPNAETEEDTELDVEARLQKMRDGWTLSSVGGITIGELFLMFGQNKKLCLEYEFEGQVCKFKEDSQESCAILNINSTETSSVVSPSRRPIISGVSNHIIIDTPTETSPSDIPGSGMAITLASEKEKLLQNRKKENMKLAETDTEDKEDERQFDKDMVEEKRVAVENLSGMLAQLLAMARVILTKSSTETCPCGHICARTGGAVRSPASGRCQGTQGIGRSPGNTRSPRTGKAATIGSQSLGVNSPGPQNASCAGLSPLHSKALRERCKPASAKRLIPEIPDAPFSLVDGRTSEASNINRSDGVEVSFLKTMSSTAIPTIATTTVSTTQRTCQLPAAAVGTGPTTTSVTELRVVLGNGGDGGEFKVPVGPAPRQAHVQQASFNAQLSKLLPRYNNRPGRRVVRKNVVVQRQLPLLPKTVIHPPSVVTMKVLQHPSQDKIKSLDGGGASGFIPITIAPSAHSVAGTASVFSSARPMASSSTCPTSSHPVRNQVIQPIKSAVNQSVVPSPVQLSVLPHNLQQASPLHAGTNAISVNISGQPLLTVEMPATVPIPPLITNSPNKFSTDLSEISSNVKVSGTDHSITSTTVDNVKSTTPVNGLLSTVVSQVLNELPDLSTPPGTPQPGLTCKTPNDDRSENFAKNLERVTSSSVATPDSCPRVPSPSLFNSPLSLDSLPSLSSGIMPNNSLVTTLSSVSSTLPPCTTPSLSPSPCITSLSSISTLLTTVSTCHLELSPPASQTNSFTSLLHTPSPHPSSNIPSTPVHTVSSSAPSISALLSSTPPDLSKSFSALLASSSHESSVSVTAAAVPELHIPEGSVNLPLLDISLGGTVTLADQTSGLLHSDPDVALEVEHHPVSHITTNASSVTPLPANTVIDMNPVQETSSDKLLDITLGISNSNSSFSSLLAAATQPRCLDSSLIGTSSVVEGCGIHGHNNGIEVNGVGAETMSGVGITGFPALSTTPPSPPSSPSRLLQQSDNQWLNSEVNDFSLSSFLGHFESPLKNSNSRGSSQAAPSGSFVPSLSSVYNENSVDFTATFAEMKAQVSGVFKQ